MFTLLGCLGVVGGVAIIFLLISQKNLQEKSKSIIISIIVCYFSFYINLMFVIPLSEGMIFTSLIFNADTTDKQKKSGASKTKPSKPPPEEEKPPQEPPPEKDDMTRSGP